MVNLEVPSFLLLFLYVQCRMHALLKLLLWGNKLGGWVQGSIERPELCSRRLAAVPVGAWSSFLSSSVGLDRIVYILKS